MVGVVPVIRPVKVALVIDAVSLATTKSSPVSISKFPAVPGRLAAAIRPLGLPVLKKKGLAFAGRMKLAPQASQIVAATRAFDRMAHHLVGAPHPLRRTSSRKLGESTILKIYASPTFG